MSEQPTSLDWSNAHAGVRIHTRADGRSDGPDRLMTGLAFSGERLRDLELRKSDHRGERPAHQPVTPAGADSGRRAPQRHRAGTKCFYPEATVAVLGSEDDA